MKKKLEIEQNILLFGNPAGKVGGEVAVCPFYAKGTCRHGKRCRMKHVIKESPKLNVYQDPRDHMENWTQEELEKNVAAKDNKVQTEIICKYFLEAIEKSKVNFLFYFKIELLRI